MKLLILGTNLSFLMFILSFVTLTQAESMRNEKYILESGDFESKAQINSEVAKPKSNYADTPDVYGGENWEARAGFPYNDSLYPFSFSISNTTVNYGALNPGEPIIRTTILTVSNKSAFGYQIVAQETNELKASESGEIVPDITCDSGTCTETTAAEWISPLTYGFGYRCDDIRGISCSEDFTTRTFYKQFANMEQKEKPQSIMNGFDILGEAQAEFTYKINISPGKEEEPYQNIIIYVATTSI